MGKAVFMPMVTLLERVRDRYITPPHPFLGQRLDFKQSYLMGLAMQAHCDGHLADQEKELFLELADAFDVERIRAERILREAEYPSETAVAQIRENLVASIYKFYFILDLQIMAHQDLEIRPVETRIIRLFGELLQIDEEDIDFLTELADAVVEEDPAAKERWSRNFFEKVRLERMANPEDFAHYICKTSADDEPS